MGTAIKATDGLVTVVHNGHVVMKIITGDNGDKAAELALAIQDLEDPPDAIRAASMAREVGFGSDQSLIVQTPKGVQSFCAGEDEIPDRYRNREIFFDLRKTPWHPEGRAGHVAIARI